MIIDLLENLNYFGFLKVETLMNDSGKKAHDASRGILFALMNE